jgi:hypothetical protein
MLAKQSGLFTLLMFYSAIALVEQNPLTRLFDNVQYELDSSVSTYFSKVQSSQADNDTLAFLTRFTLKSQTRLTENIYAGFETYATYSTQKQDYSGVFRLPNQENRQPRLVDFNTAWLRYKSDDFNLSVGKDYLKNGLSEIFSPVDRFGVYNLVNPSQFYRLGVWQAGIDYFINDDTLSLKILPVTEKVLVPSFSSRWLGNITDPEFITLLSHIQIVEKYRTVNFKNAAYLLQYKGSRAGYDFFGLLHHGPSIYPTLHYGGQINQLLKTEPLATSLSAGILKMIKEWKLYGEAIYQHADNHQDQDFIRYSVGVSYSDTHWANVWGLNQITSTVQWTGDETLDTKISAEVFMASRKARPFRNTLFTSVEIEQNDKWRYLVSNIYNLGGDYAILMGVQYKPNDNLSLRLEGDVFAGHKNTLFGRWQENDFLRFRVIYKF